MSGPGPFEGVSTVIPVACAFGPQEPDVDDHTIVVGTPCLLPWLLPEAYRVERDRPQARRRTVTIALNLARLSTNRNNLQYTQPPAEPGVNWFKFGPAVVWHVNEHLDVHTSLEWNRLTSKGDVFDPIWVSTIELVGVTWHPFANRPKPLRGLAVPVRAKMLTRSVDAGEFGAIPGSYQTGREVQLQVGIAYNFWGLR
jgi:hypothetical protein